MYLYKRGQIRLAYKITESENFQDDSEICRARGAVYMDSFNKPKASERDLQCDLQSKADSPEIPHQRAPGASPSTKTKEPAV